MDASTHNWAITNKRAILDQLRAARSVQLQWRTYTQALASGTAKHQAGVQARSKFNCWYWSASRQLSALKSFEAISATHKSMLQVDHQILNLLSIEGPPTNFMKWFRSPKGNKVHQAAKAKHLVPNLVKKSSELLANMEALEKEIKGMSENELISASGKHENKGPSG
jgi:hypothetical protein